ncbi:MAG: hypothetical protein B7733_04050 [Myxococcales bacterium FL481]|nr:MAG: hypothetical protein B7733_04050 [Myxococcales bacterium FL481]
MSLLIDTGSPVTAVSNSAASASLGASCLELRSGRGLAGSSDPQAALPAAVARFRFEDAPQVVLPVAADWPWRVGRGDATRHVAGVLGGNVLNEFAVLLRSDGGEPPSVAFFREFPGSEARLAADGRAFIPVQYPRRLVGVIAQDRCEIAGLDCELAGLDLDPDDERIIFESTRMVVDSCVAPPPCGPHYDVDGGTCRLSPGGADPHRSCDAADSGANAGLNASLLVATGVAHSVLFADSAERLFGPLSALPWCDALDLGSEVRACRERETTSLYLPGWANVGTELPQLRVRSLAFVPGLSTASGPSPCARHQRRLRGAAVQCAAYLASHRPSGPEESPVTSSRGGLVIRGEVQWGTNRVSPDPTRWIDVTVLAADQPFVAALRRDVGSRPVQLDGLVGSTILQQSEVIVDYTETSPGPGVRVTCLSPEDGTCLSLPDCRGRQDDVACCFGLPQSLLRRVIRDSVVKPAPRSEELCCRALSRASLHEMQHLDLTACEGTAPP